MLTPVPAWENRRSVFNHDWLVNQYLNSLNAFIKRLENGKPDLRRIEEFISDSLPEWGSHKQGLKEIISSFEKEMSPQCLFERPPLEQCDVTTKRWLAPLVHELWVRRHPVKKWIEAVTLAFREGDKMYSELIYEIGSWEITDINKLKTLLPQFQKFRDFCINLSNSLSSLPHKILVT